MRLLTSELPSHGYNCSLRDINLRPMTYLDMIKYDEDCPDKDEKDRNKLKQLLVDIDLLRKDCPPIVDLNYFDFDSVLMTKKLISVTEAPRLRINDHKCPHCGHVYQILINIIDLEYSNFDYKFISKLDSLILGGKRIKLRFPKLKNVLDLATKLNAFDQDINFKLFESMLILDFESAPNDVKEAVVRASKGDIMLLEHMKSYLLGGMKEYITECPSCKRKETVSVLNTLAGMFRLLQLNEAVDKTKIVLQ